MRPRENASVQRGLLGLVANGRTMVEDWSIERDADRGREQRSSANASGANDDRERAGQ